MLDIVVQNLYSQKYKYWLLMCNLGFLSLLLYKINNSCIEFVL